MKYRILLFIVSLFALSACAKTLSPEAYQQANKGLKIHEQQGVILSKKPMIYENYQFAKNDARNYGYSAGHSASTGNVGANIAGGIAGTLIGVAIANKIEYNKAHQKVDVYQIRLDSGKVVNLMQPRGLALNKGQAVLIEYGSKTLIKPIKGSA